MMLMVHLFFLERKSCSKFGYATKNVAFRGTRLPSAEKWPARRTSSSLMLLENFFNFVQGKFVKFCYLGFRSKLRGNNAGSLGFVSNVSDDPGFVLAIHASPFRMAQKV
jgi:hypothetical protein